MAIRSFIIHNQVYVDNSSYVMNETGSRGRVVVHSTTTTGTGGLLDSSDSVVRLPNNVNGSGEYPAGILLNDVVDLDLTRYHKNQHKPDMQVGGKVSLLKIGSILTDDVAVGVTPSPGMPAYFTVEGMLSSTSTNSTRVGTFRGGKDTDGYVRVDINIM